MITINSCLHRVELNNIIGRWMYGDLDQGDAAKLTRIVHFNHVYINRYLSFFAENLFKSLHGEITPRLVSTKGELKDIIFLNPPYRNPRIDALIRNYRSHPERFYRETPFFASLYFTGANGYDKYVGSQRIKSVNRVAEKSARLIIDWIYETIREKADTLAHERARRLGIGKEQLITSDEEMVDEFIRAEERLFDDFRSGRPLSKEASISINDVAGIKVILEDAEHELLLSRLADMGECEVLEKEIHTGKYNATNIILRYHSPKSPFILAPLSERMVSVMQMRGISEKDANAAYADFVRSGEESVNLEIIISNYGEMLESEIGRCMHEDRIMEQRNSRQYFSHLAKNVEFLMKYMFTFPFSPQLGIRELPLRIWNRYLPDYFEDVMRKLFQLAPVRI